MKSWLKTYTPTIGALTGVVVAAVAILQIVVVGPMNQRFGDMNQRFDEMRSDMNQRFDDMNQRFGDMNQRFGDMNQRFGDMNQRFDELRSDMTARFEAQDKYMTLRFDEQNRYMKARFDAVEQRLDRLDNEVSELRSLSDRVSRNEGQIKLITERLNTTPASPPGP